MKKSLIWLLSLIGVVLIGGFLFSFYKFRDRHPGYQVDLNLRSSQNQILAGFSKVDISPNFFETWVDANGDSRYNPEDGDTYTDTNGNGEFDAIWLAGFHNSRPAKGILDPLWARAMVLDGGDVKIAICVIDMIGFGNDEVIATRKLIQESIPWLDYIVVSSTHTHASPDLMGLWGPKQLKSGVNPDYLNQVMMGIKEAVVKASEKLRPAAFRFIEENERLKPLVGDTRAPEVFDASLKLMQVIDAETNETLGTIMNWGNHPETLWSENIHISSDFPSPWRDSVEKGVFQGDSVVVQGLGGVAIFLNGAVGGLMTTHPSLVVKDPITGIEYLRQSPEKIEAQGKALAKITLEALSSRNVVELSQLNLGIQAKSIELKMDNKLFLLAAYLGIFDRGFTSWQHIRSEVAAITLGPATFVFVPGELYPEILHGGIESPEGADYGIEPVEMPSIQSQMPGDFKFFAGMSNDMIGYILPKSQWDVKPPFTYGQDDRPYGEINSLGPETGPAIHRAVMEVIKK